VKGEGWEVGKEVSEIRNPETPGTAFTRKNELVKKYNIGKKNERTRRGAFRGGRE